MTARPVLWAAAMSVSLGAHVAAAAVLVWATYPEDVPVQQPPETEMQLAAYQVQRSEAREATPDAQELTSGDTSGSQVDQNAVATSRADAQVLPSPVVPALSNEGAPVEAAAMPSDMATLQDPAGTAAPPLAATGTAIATNPARPTVIAAAPATPGAAAAPVQPAANPAQVLDAAVPTLMARAATGETVAPSAAAALAVSTPSSPIAANAPTLSAQIAMAQSLAPSATAAMSQAAPTRPVGADAPTLAARIAPGETLTPVVTAALSVSTPARPTNAPTLSSQAATGEMLSGIVAAALTVPQSRPELEPAPTAPVDSETVGASRPDIPASESSALSPTPVDQSETTAQAAPIVVPPVARSKASLAFAASGDGPVDPVSLTAFQSFMSPGDLGQQAAEVRDSIASTLSSVPCSRLQMRYDPDENAVIMSGHVPEAELRGSVLAAMQTQMGANIPVRQELLVLPRPQCGALTGIAQVGLPQSTDQITNPLLVGESTQAREFTYVDGQALILDLQGADYDAYVYVDFFDAAGNVLHLMPNEFTPMAQTPAKSALRIGSDRELAAGEPGLFIRIGPPYGQEIAVAFAASEPLYDGVRPLVETAEPYLDWLRTRVSEARAAHPEFKGEWVYFFVTTAEN